MSESSKIWHSIRMIFYSVTAAFLALSAGLFGYAHALSKGKSFGCLLFRNDQVFNPNYSSCDFSISGAALAAVGFAVLANLVGIKVGYSKLRESWITLAVEIAILVISSLFVVATAIVLIVGWRITCDNVEGQGHSTLLNERKFTCSSHSDIVGPATASIVFVSLAVFLILQISIFIMYKIFKVITKRE